MIKAILFDLDDTLKCFMETKQEACNAAIDAMIKSGLKMNKKKAAKILFELYKKHGIEDRTIFQKFLRKTQGKIDYKILTAGIVAYRNVAIKHSKPFPGVISTLKKLRKRKIKLGVVSDAPSIKVWLRLTETGLRDYFDAVVTLYDTKKKKPHPKPFMLALKKLKTKPEQTLFVGDNLERDIKGAKEVGMKTAFASYGTNTPNISKKELKKFMPDYILAKPWDVWKDNTIMVRRRKS